MPGGIKHRLILLSALAGTTYSAAPRNVFAGQCTPASGDSIICQGPPNSATDITQTLSGLSNGVNVTTQPGFGIDTSVTGGDAITISASNGNLVVNDQNNSTITGAQNGLSTTLNSGNGLTVTTTGAVKGVDADGILAQNNGSGALIINATAVSGGALGDGIQATNGSIATPAGTGITITTSGPVTGGQMGIIARNYGSGAITINATDTVEVTGGNFGDQWAGLFARNGNLAADGTVTRAGTNITITASGNVTGFYNGVASYNFGSGSNVVHVTGDVVGRTQAGILARNGIFDPPGPAVGPIQAGTFISVIAEGNVRGAFQGIRVDNVGTGHIEITSTGNVEALLDNGIVAHNSQYGTYLTITANNVVGGRDGINAFNEGSGPLTVTTKGAVIGRDNGIVLATSSTHAELYVSGLVAGSQTAVDATAVATTVRMELQPGYSIHGIVDARNADSPQGNRLVLGGPSGEAWFNLSKIAGTTVQSSDVYFGFDRVFLKEDASNFVFTGKNQPGAEYASAVVTGTGLAVLKSDARLIMANGATPFTVQSGGLGAIGHGGVLDGNVLVWNGGSIVLSNAGPFDRVAGLSGANDVLTMSGNYHSNGGALYVDATLNDGATGVSDKLVVKGDTSGSTKVFVSNDGGQGGITGRGPTDGIKVVQVHGASGGSFDLGAPVYAGAFQYGLFQADSQNWYLQTTNLRDQAVANPYIPYSLRTFGRQITGSYLERTGGRMGWQLDGGSFAFASAYGGGADYLPTKGPVAPSPVASYGTWARALGAWSSADGTLLGGFNNVSYSETLWAVQGGFDAAVMADNTNSLIASAFLHYGGINTRSTNELTGRSAGQIDTKGWGGGLALTYATRSGLYVDGVGTYTHYDLGVATSPGTSGSTDANGITVSGEVGHRVALNAWATLTPQAQLIYQRISVGSFVDNAGVAASFSDASSLEGRLGARMELASASAARFYLGANLLHEFLGNPVANVAGTPLALGFDGSGYQVEGGIKFGTVGGRLSGWLRGDYRAPFSANNGIATWNATGGVAARF